MKLTELPAFFQGKGWDSYSDLATHVFYAKFSEAFLDWRREDGSKDGLLSKVGLREDFNPSVLSAR